MPQSLPNLKFQEANECEALAKPRSTAGRSRPASSRNPVGQRDACEDSHLDHSGRSGGECRVEERAERAAGAPRRIGADPRPLRRRSGCGVFRDAVPGRVAGKPSPHNGARGFSSVPWAAPLPESLPRFAEGSGVQMVVFHRERAGRPGHPPHLSARTPSAWWALVDLPR